MITLHSLFKAYGLNPQDVRLVRHSNREINILDIYHNDIERFTQYASWQLANKFGKSKYLAMFAPDRGTTALFLGVWEVEGVTSNSNLNQSHLAILQKYNLSEDWYRTSVHYHLKQTDLLKDLSERLVIEWGGATVSWVQLKDKDIVQIKPANLIGDFVSYDDIQLSYAELVRMVKASVSNATWINALSSVNGVYLIRNKRNGKLYVGSAYGNDGIFGRWRSYANTGHGGNKQLKELNPENFEFSILEIAPSTMSADEVIARENRWKIRFGTREFGLNDN
ncbi:GIY-YIG nuclease family protein [Pseudomonadota bacterium]